MTDDVPRHAVDLDALKRLYARSYGPTSEGFRKDILALISEVEYLRAALVAVRKAT